MVGLNGNISFSTIQPHTYHMSKKYVLTINKWTRLLGNTVFARKKYWILQRKKLSISAYKRTVFIQLRKFEMLIYLHRKNRQDTYLYLIVTIMFQTRVKTKKYRFIYQEYIATIIFYIYKHTYKI